MWVLEGKGCIFIPFHEYICKITLYGKNLKWSLNDTLQLPLECHDITEISWECKNAWTLQHSNYENIEFMQIYQIHLWTGSMLGILGTWKNIASV